jgi:hypothetical protein
MKTHHYTYGGMAAADLRPPTFARLPHGPYVNAVGDALANAGLGAEITAAASGSDLMIGNRLPVAARAVFRWTDLMDAVQRSTARPYGLHLFWEHTADTWTWTERWEDGTYDPPQTLPGLGRYAAPEAVVATVRALLDGAPLPEGSAPYWHPADGVKAAVEAWAAGREDAR